MAIVPDEPSRVKGLCQWNLTSTTTLHIHHCPHCSSPIHCCVASHFAYQAHTAHLLQPHTSASAYSVAVVLDITVDHVLAWIELCYK